MGSADLFPQPSVKHQLVPWDHGCGASASQNEAACGPAFTSTKLYCLVTRARGCKQLAQSLPSCTLTGKLNSWPLDFKSDTQPVVQPCHPSTLFCTYNCIFISFNWSTKIELLHIEKNSKRQQNYYCHTAAKLFKLYSLCNAWVTVPILNTTFLQFLHWETQIGWEWLKQCIKFQQEQESNFDNMVSVSQIQLPRMLRNQINKEPQIIICCPSKYDSRLYFLTSTSKLFYTARKCCLGAP